METIGIIIFIVMSYVLCKLHEWISDSRTSEDGYHTDWLEASEDIRKYGKQYFYKQNTRGKYDKKTK